jgi:mono/diheme cytochrome c family protein
VTSTLVITVVVIAAIGWLAFLGVSALRSRGSEEVPSNLAPGQSDDTLETKRLERAQQAAVLLSAFLAIGLPLYYLTETNRQEGFVEQFDEESVTRGEHLVEEFGCYGCHGPGGSGGVAAYVEKRTGATVSWAAPSINDLFYRYDRDQIRYWLVYGRGNSPMPAWGVAGGGPMNDQQIEDVINFLATEQVPQAEANNLVEQNIANALTDLQNASAQVESAIIDQRQKIADLRQAPALAPIAADIAARAQATLDGAGQGIDTDGDTLSDSSEQALSDIAAEAKVAFLPPGLTEIKLDPTVPDRQVVDQAVAAITELIETERAPILIPVLVNIENAITAGGDDADGDGISDTAEAQIPGFIAQGVGNAIAGGFQAVRLDSSNPESIGGETDLEAARRLVAALQTIATNLDVQANNLDALLLPAEDALDNLNVAKAARRWEFDFRAIADGSFGGDLERAQRVVGIYNAYCARCHTSGWSAGAAFSQPAGSGGFAPSLWDGRPAVQFLSDEDLKNFLIVGAQANRPYGVNGFGNGQMPAFGALLSENDLLDLATWLRSGDLTGKGAVR